MVRRWMRKLLDAAITVLALMWRIALSTPNKGDSQLAAVWQDPDYDPAQKAFYYVRGSGNT